MSQHSTARMAAILAASVVVLAGCSTPAAPGEPGGTGDDEAVVTPGVTADTVTIGTHTPLTGPAAAGYSTISAAASAYFAYLNDQGGVHGRSIEYLVEDDGYNPSNTQTVVRELVQQEEVFAIVNGLGTPPHTAVIDYLNQNEVPDLFVASGSVTWNQPEEYPYTYGFNADYVVEGAALAQYATEQNPDAVVCLFGQDDDFGDDMIRGAELVLGEGGLAHVERYSSANQDVTAQIAALKDAGCEITILGTINGFTALAVGTAAQLGWMPQWYSSSSGADYPTLAGFLGEAAPQLLQGLVGTNYLPALDGDSEWVTLFRQINDDYNDGAPFDGNTIYGMSMAYLFAEALDAAGENPTRQSLLDALSSGELKGNGILPLAFGPDSHAAYTGVGITIVDQGAQDYVGATYAVDGDTVSAVEPAPVPFVPGGVPGA